MKITILLIILFGSVLSSCGGLEETTDPPRREDEPEGEPKPPKIDVLEFTNWRDFFKNCKPEYDTPDNLTDIIVGAVPKLNDYYLPKLFRACFKKKSADAHEQICNARDHWERIRKKPRSPSQKAKAENELIKLELLEANLNDKLYRLGSKARDRMQKIRSYKPKSKTKKIVNLWAEDEAEGWEGLLNVQAYSSCTVYTDDDDDDD